jgi:hypothetical protein
MSDDELDAIILEAFKVPPAYDHHYPLAPNQLAYLIHLVAKAEREACAELCEEVAQTVVRAKRPPALNCADAIRARK